MPLDFPYTAVPNTVYVVLQIFVFTIVVLRVAITIFAPRVTSAVVDFIVAVVVTVVVVFVMIDRVRRLWRKFNVD